MSYDVRLKPCAFPKCLVCRLYSVNVNHGPGVSEWYAVSPEHAPKLRNAILRQYGMDITAGGCWFPSLEFCEQHGVPVMFGLQQPGDVVVLNGAFTLRFFDGEAISIIVMRLGTSRRWHTALGPLSGCFRSFVVESCTSQRPCGTFSYLLVLLVP
jgi:hypothetical protein